jgi:hypothetical protein
MRNTVRLQDGNGKADKHSDESCETDLPDVQSRLRLEGS